jgi:hypothetical protein
MNIKAEELIQELSRPQIPEHKPPRSEIVKPFSPSEALASKVNTIPPEIIEAVNVLLSEKFSGKHTVTIFQKEILTLAKSFMVRRARAYANEDSVERNWLDFGPLFEKEGWKVEYDSPVHCESYAPFFKFTPKK